MYFQTHIDPDTSVPSLTRHDDVTLVLQRPDRRRPGDTTAETGDGRAGGDAGLDTQQTDICAWLDQIQAVWPVEDVILGWE